MRSCPSFGRLVVRGGTVCPPPPPSWPEVGSRYFRMASDSIISNRHVLICTYALSFRMTIPIFIYYCFVFIISFSLLSLIYFLLLFKFLKYLLLYFHFHSYV